MSWSWRRFWAVVATGGLLAGATSFGSVATAQEQVEKPAPVMVTVDASGSMADALGDGRTKMDAAKGALNTLVDGVEPDTQMGLQVYGSRGAGSGSGKPDCDAISTEVPVGPVDAEDLKSKVDGLQPAGETPIGDSLREAADELPDEGPRAIVLISDGIDTCAPPDPCEVSKELAESGVDLAVHTVGFQIDDEAREQLSCIAESTGGSYTDAPDAKSLDEQLPRVVERAQRSYEVKGTAITGTEEFPSAPTIEAGQYVDTIDSGQTKYYKVRIPKDFTVHFAATAVLPRDEEGGWVEVTTQLVDPQGKVCEEQDEDVHIASALRKSSAAHATSAFSVDTREDSDCNADEEYYLSVERDGPSEAKYWTWQTELLVTLEPPVSGSTGPAENTAEVPFGNPGGAEQAVTGGGSFNDAVELDGSGIYADTLLVNEMATYKVKLDWGESLAVQTHARNDPKDWAEVTYDIYDPVRQQGSRNWNEDFNLYNEADSGDPIATSRVLYNNREEGKQASVPGWYYITVHVGSSTDEYTELPIRLFVSKGGEKVAGPEYVSTDGYPQGLVTGGSDEGDEREQAVRQAATEDEVGMPLWGWLAIGGGALLCGGAATFVALRRNTHS
ncbi:MULTISPECIES: vWA domain-containing protein [Prauserella salsuginis group]|uniref:VWA domain-containing protein n=1 Tax=Prauserella salsuginis TaxID=387889 RepID=A0ABW6G8L5_9PSEU|nr:MULTISPECIES: VWA domain-containing protein [Prauserella salsuginis group]MCR3722623.1 Ca-activated chloride channel family protein [Prauserella flava]MCR3737065.1 Ca-activated chloride channel family protein [Prauserella salsuginis]